ALEKVRRALEPAQMAALHEHDRRLDADAGARHALQPPAPRMRREESRGDEPEADPARHERYLHVDIVDRGGDFEWSAEFAQSRLERLTDEASRRVEHPACVEIAILRPAAAPCAWSPRPHQYQTFGRQETARHIAGRRVVRREEP